MEQGGEEQRGSRIICRLGPPVQHGVCRKRCAGNGRQYREGHCQHIIQLLYLAYIFIQNSLLNIRCQIERIMMQSTFLTNLTTTDGDAGLTLFRCDMEAKTMLTWPRIPLTLPKAP